MSLACNMRTFKKYGQRQSVDPHGRHINSEHRQQQPGRWPEINRKNKSKPIIYNDFFPVFMIEPSIIDTALNAACRPRLLENPVQLEAVADDWRGTAIVGIDTEFLRERTYRAQLGLIQVSDGSTAWLVDMVQLENPEPLTQLLADKNVLKVFHSASEDLEVLWNTLGVAPWPMVDTQIACALLGQPLQMSYHHAVKWLTGIEVDKELTRSNWIRRPLKPAQLHYAATDVVFLPAMLKTLRNRLQQKGRWSWLEEDVAKMVENSQQPSDPESAYLRLKGSGQLDMSSLNVLKELAAWRERTASQRNLARGFVISDSALLKLATGKPTDRAGLSDLSGLHPGPLNRYQHELLEMIRQNRDRQESIEQPLPLNSEQRRILNVMRDVVHKEASRLSLDPAILASKKQLEALVRARQSGSSIPERLCGWRQDVITNSLLQIMEVQNGR